ncbi:DNA repair protein RecO [Kiloniella laminariae]|uniref:DNA repair protein RecO n=1 Tax=Kiloniella laminariae TaxID=454162 RepID=A0ABT4LGF9_9PROT|nr:DNA repair protein RecO [Kiloniella laminariae]MCZ4280179.1 DNA repair protein RecO [Kiloniella laminariae]
MIHWEDEGILLSARPFGENDLIAQVLTKEHGRHAGLVRGGQGRTKRATFEPGNRLHVRWKGRLTEHLGNYDAEVLDNISGRLFDEPGRLAALLSAVAICEQAVPERDDHPVFYEGLLTLMAHLESEFWGEVYVRWELAQLSALGFGIDLSGCAGGGDNDQLAYISPKSGRAVSLAAGEPYRDRLFTLPLFLLGKGNGGSDEIAQGLKISGHFLERHLFHPHDRSLPSVRDRLLENFL